jgi:hypothetical protein
LVQLERDHAAAGSDEEWPAFYAARLRQTFSSA